MRWHLAMIAQLACCGIALAAPRLDPSLVERTRAALTVLRAADAPLARMADVRRVERAMRQVRRGVDAYFHAPNLLKARPLALTMRAVVRELRGGDAPILRIVDDVVRFDAALHDRLATACEALSNARCARAHRLDALISDPTPARIEAARARLPAKARPRFDARFKAVAAPASRPE